MKGGNTVHVEENKDSSRKCSQSAAFTIRSPAFWTCPHCINRALHQVGLRNITSWLLTSGSQKQHLLCWENISSLECLGSNKTASSGVLVWDIDFTLNSPELAFSELDSATYKEGSCQMQRKQNSCWLVALELQEGDLNLIFLWPFYHDWPHHI